MHYIYSYTDPTTKEPYYIGKGTYKRYNWHLNRAKNNRRPTDLPVVDKTRHLLTEGLKPVIEIIEYFDTIEEAHSRETELIRKIGRKDLGTGPLLNLTDGGDGAVGRKWSNTRRKSWSGDGNPAYGKVPWKEAGLNNPMLGRKHSEESRAKMSKRFKESYTREHQLARSSRVQGSNNPSYGKPAKNRRPVLFRGIKFDCIAHACRHFSVTKGTIYKEGIFD